MEKQKNNKFKKRRRPPKIDGAKTGVRIRVGSELSGREIPMGEM